MCPSDSSDQEDHFDHDDDLRRAMSQPPKTFRPLRTGFHLSLSEAARQLLSANGACSIFVRRELRRPLKQSIVHSLGTLKPPRNFNASESKLMDRSPSEREEALDERYDRLTCPLATKDWEASTFPRKTCQVPVSRYEFGGRYDRQGASK